MTGLHATFVGSGGGEVGGGKDDRRRFVFTVEFVLELRDGFVEFPNGLEVLLPVRSDGVARGESTRGGIPIDTIALDADCVSFDERFENDVHCPVDVPARMERDGGRDLSWSLE